MYHENNRLKMKKPLLYLLVLLVAVFSTSCTQSSKGTFEVGDKTFLLNGEPFVVKAAEIHYPRIPKEYWEHRIKMSKALGMNTICLYVFWNFHEPEEGKYDFTGQKDIAAFCRMAQENGMYVIVRPGPYVCAEWEMGGLPWWLLKKEDMYGYQLVQETERRSGGRIVTQEGSLYPVLYKLVDQGLISDRKVLVGRRMTRVYYHLEPAGEQRLEELVREYEEVTKGVFQIIEGDGQQ